MTAREFAQRKLGSFWDRRPGFSLMEVLIAASLMGLVVGLAVQGFVEAKKIGDLTQSKMVARQQANEGVQKLAKILRRCHIIFFSTRPLPLAEITAATNLSNLLATPATLKDAVSGVANAQLRSALSSPNQLIERYSSISTAPRKDFRAQDQYTGGGFDGIKLQSGMLAGTACNDAEKPTLDFDKGFTSPLLYCAEAQLAGGRGADNQQMDAGYAMSWTIYLVYLAPMALKVPDDAPIFPANRSTTSVKGKRDLNGTCARSTVPYELRLLTIPDLRALKGMPPNKDGWATGDGATPWTATGTNNAMLLPTGRKVNTVKVLAPPYDVAKKNVNFDPVPIPNKDTADTYNHALTVSGADSSGGRVGDVDNWHHNFNNVGNDPPAEGAFSNLGRWNGSSIDYGAARNITDTVLAAHIDPDNVHGTCVRLANDFGDGVQLIAKGETQARPYVNAIGGPQAYNPQWWNAGNPTSVGPPKRALVSVSTRCRINVDTAFAFASESVEVELEPLVRYQTELKRRTTQ